MNTTAVIFLKSEFKSEIVKTGSDEYQAFHPIVSSTIYRWVGIPLLWTEHIYLHLNNNPFIVAGISETYNKEVKKNSRSTSVSQHCAEYF